MSEALLVPPLSAREVRYLERSELGHRILLGAIAAMWAMFLFSAWWRVSDLLGAGIPGLTTLEELLALGPARGESYDAVQVYAMLTVEKIAADLQRAVMASIFGLAMYWQSRLTTRLWRSVRGGSPAGSE